VTEAEKLIRESKKEKKCESIEIDEHKGDQEVVQPMVKLPAIDIPTFSANMKNGRRSTRYLLRLYIQIRI